MSRFKVCSGGKAEELSGPESCRSGPCVLVGPQAVIRHDPDWALQRLTVTKNDLEACPQPSGKATGRLSSAGSGSVVYFCWSRGYTSAFRELP